MICSNKFTQFTICFDVKTHKVTIVPMCFPVYICFMSMFMVLPCVCSVNFLKSSLSYNSLLCYIYFSNTHQENVITSMETVMKFVIDESEDVQQDMPSCLLQDLASYLLKNLKKEEKETLPASFELAEKVINKCYEKLKPVFTPLLRGTPLDEYSEVVTSLFEDALDAGVADNSDAPGKDMVSQTTNKFPF
jgi:hypothetical protein